MTERYKIRVISFYCTYCIILSLFTSFFFWFDAGLLISWFRLLLLLVIPVPILWRSKEKQLEKEKQKEKLEKKLPPQPLVVLWAAGFMGESVSLMYEKKDNFWLACFFFAASIGLYFVGEYLRGRYLLFYCNPGVSAETIRRSGKGAKRTLIEMAVAGVVTLVLLLFISQFEPELPVQKQQKTNTVQQETDRAPEEKKGRPNEKQSKIQEEQEKQGQNLFLLILRYTLFIAIVVMGIVAVCYGLYRFLYYLIRGRRRPVWEFEEIEIEESNNEIYTRLVPVVRSEAVFPSGNDGKIRREFYRAVRRQAGNKEIVRSHTPMELKEAYLASSEKDTVLTELYEKARYARESVTEEELRQWEKIN